MHWFGVPGLSNGLAVMRDEESESLWDHITGECFEGPLSGERLDWWPIHMTNLEAELQLHKETRLLKSDYRSLKSMIMKGVAGSRLSIRNQGTVLAPHFRATMNGDIDPRLPEGEQGLGVMTTDDVGKFYPLARLGKGPVHDRWNGRPLTIEVGPIDGIPSAAWEDTGEPPMQLLTRWYGFAFTYPGCEIFEG